jgi:hypothetical protein
MGSMKNPAELHVVDRSTTKKAGSIRTQQLFSYLLPLNMLLFEPTTAASCSTR